MFRPPAVRLTDETCKDEPGEPARLFAARLARGYWPLAIGCQLEHEIGRAGPGMLDQIKDSLWAEASS